jgi:hypothetical protein
VKRFPLPRLQDDVHGISGGWLDADARDLGELAAKIESGHKVQVKDGPWWPDDILEEI